MDDYAADIRAVLDELGVELAALIGAGFGGEVALHFGRDLARAARACSRSPGRRPRPEHAAYDAALRAARARPARRRAARRPLRHDSPRRPGGAPAPRRLREGGPARSLPAASTRRRSSRRLRARRERPDLTPQLAARLTMPVLIAAGEDDPTRSGRGRDRERAARPRVSSPSVAADTGVAFLRAKAFEQVLGSFFGDVLSGRPVAGSLTA